MTRPAPVQDETDELEELRARVAAGEMPDPDGVRAPGLARLVAVAAGCGAPLLPALDAAAEGIRDRAEIVDAVRVATAQARAVAIGLLALPLLLVPGLGAMLDLDLVGFYGSPIGSLVAVTAGGLLATGGAIIRVLIRRAGRLGTVPHDGAATDDEVIDLLAAATAGAAAPAHACQLVAVHAATHRQALQRCALALQLDDAVDVPDPLGRVLDTLSRSGRLGAPAAPALRRVAAAVRSQRRTRALESAQRLPALLTFPTALCLLPASVLLVGAPLIASGLESVGAGI